MLMQFILLHGVLTLPAYVDLRDISPHENPPRTCFEYFNVEEKTMRSLFHEAISCQLSQVEPPFKECPMNMMNVYYLPYMPIHSIQRHI